ncbi:MAG: hypothetical protein LAN62_07745 [Acidobacteriia bacterium]|nr:hypothetical protein [Terriglobia bacterium]
MKYIVSLILALSFIGPTLLAAVRGDKTMYVGGTVNIPQKTEGILNLEDEKVAVFTYEGGRYELPYAQVTIMEYGQKAGRRVGATVAGFAAFGVPGLIALFSRKRKHFLSIALTNAEGKNQAIVLELSKGNVRTILRTMEARTGKRIEYESEEAKKNIGQ